MTSSARLDSTVDELLRSLDTCLQKAGATRAGRGLVRRANNPATKLDKTLMAELTDGSKLRTEPRDAPNGVRWLPATGWEKFPWLWHGFSTRQGGTSQTYTSELGQSELNLGFTADDPAETVTANRRLLVEAITGRPDVPLVTVRQVHSNIVVVADRESAMRSKPPKADGLMTDRPGLLLGVQTADCIPVLVADRKRRAVAAFHAGWRGTVQRIVETGIGRMRLEFGSRPEDLIAAIGPGVGQCCYAVGEEVLSQFDSQFAYGRELFVEVEGDDPVRARYVSMFLNQRAPGHGPRSSSLHLDLAEANRRQLLDAGLTSKSIQMTRGCTSCRSDLFFSHRASGGHTGRMMTVIGLRPL